MNLVIILVCLQPLTQFQIKIKARELQKSACLITTFSNFSLQ